MLCNLCQIIDFRGSPLHQEAQAGWPVGNGDGRTGYYVYIHHPSIEALQVAATKGCHLCNQIRQELFHTRGHERDDAYHKGPIEVRYYPDVDKEQNVLQPETILVVAKTPIRDVKLFFDLVQFPSSLTELVSQKAADNDPSTGCEGNFKLAITWLNRCLSSHELCTISTHPCPPLPSRILDVDSPESSGCIRLCCSEGRHGPYITLSHVWGQAQVITTTLSTLQVRMTMIAMESMSQTFQDAVVIARQLGVRYIWIDSLCIIQDSFGDWLKESSKMGDYYMNSLFTITAVSASDGSEGCFMERNSLNVAPCPINLRFPALTQDQSALFFLRPNFNRDPVLETEGFQRPPLWQRAWVVQERLLSARTLQFSSMQLSWRCRTEDASERVPEGIKHPYLRPGDRILREVLVGLKKFPLKTDIANGQFSSEPNLACGTATELVDLYNGWYDLVSLYGKCTLTKESDIFPAIWGIAKAIANVTGDRYLGGLWEHDLHRGLLWSTPDSTSLKPDLRNYRAPSWSWASLKATCTFYVREISQAGLNVETGCFKLEGAATVASEVNPYTDLKTGELRITGLLKRAHPKGEDGEEIFKKISHGEYRETLFDLEQQIPIGFYFADNIDRKYLTEIWCSPVMIEEEIVPRKFGAFHDTQRSPRPIDVRCLALIPLSKTDSIYMRVGNAWIKDFAWFSDCQMSSFSIV